MNLLCSVLGAFANVTHTAIIRVRCLRLGHRFGCVSDGHICRRCGRFWGYWD